MLDSYGHGRPVILHGPGNDAALDQLRRQGWVVDRHTFLPTTAPTDAHERTTR